MCGIAGVSSFGEQPVARRQLQLAWQRLEHRGPDDANVWISDDVRTGLSHTRLAILDLELGTQPMGNEDDTLQVVFNGEIYNHVELRQQLAARGHCFRTRSDTEVLLHLYEEHGVGMLEHLVGMFAFGLWDAPRCRLLLARDRLGQKPLFFAVNGSRLSFASEIKGLLPLLDKRPAVDPVAIDHFLTFQYVPGDCCAFAGIEKLGPGEYLSWSPEGIERCRYWQRPVPRGDFAGTFDEAATELRSLLREATRIRLRSDVPLGVLLSGGIDSALVVGLMAEAGIHPIRTYTASFAQGGPDERPFARAIAQRYGTEHHELIVPPPTATQIEQVLDQYDEPFADTSAVPTYLICQRAREHVKVVLTGDGGDESFLGYDRYVRYRRYLAQRRWLQPLLVGTGLNALGRCLPASPERRTWRRRLRTLLTLWDPSPSAVYERWLAAFMGPAKERLCRLTFRRQVGAELSATDRVSKGLCEVGASDWVSAAAAFDLATYLPDAVLTKVDRASMAHGLECRSPFLDHRVVELAARLPTEWKLSSRSRLQMGPALWLPRPAA